MSREDVDQLFGDLKNPALANGIAPVLADHVPALIGDHGLRWESAKAEAFTFGKEEARIMVNELLRELCTASTVGHTNPVSSLSVLGVFQITNSTGNRPGASVASNNRDIGVRDRGLLCKHARFLVATEIAQDGQELIVGYSMLLKMIQGKYLNTPGQQRARK